MIWVAIVALLTLPMIWIRRVERAMEDFYGPAGRLERMGQVEKVTSPPH